MDKKIEKVFDVNKIILEMASKSKAVEKLVIDYIEYNPNNKKFIAKYKKKPKGGSKWN